MVRFLAVSFAGGVLCAAPAAWAEVYTWTDGNGDEHFTDDLRKVPEPHRKKYLDEIAAEKRAKFESEAKKREESVRRAREDAFNAEMARKAPKNVRPGAAAPAPAAPRDEKAHRPEPAVKHTVGPAVERSETKTGAAAEKQPVTRRPYEGWQGSAKTDKLAEEEIEERRNKDRRSRDKKHIERILDSHRTSIKALKEEFERIKDVSSVHADVEKQRQRLKEEIKRFTEEIEYWEEIVRMDY